MWFISVQFELKTNKLEEIRVVNLLMLTYTYTSVLVVLMPQSINERQGNEVNLLDCLIKVVTVLVFSVITFRKLSTPKHILDPLFKLMGLLITWRNSVQL